MIRIATVALLILGLTVPSTPAFGQTRGARERDLREWTVKAEKMRAHLQPAMRKHEVDMWIVMSRENHPDPALDLFGGYGLTGWYGHRNAYIFYDPGEGRPLETVVMGTHLSGHLDQFYDRIISYHGNGEGLAPLLREYVHEKDPATIAINQSRTISMADGISVELKKYLVDAIGPTYADRLVSSEPLFIDYVSHRTPAEIEIGKEAAWKTWNILRRAFSSEVITPGETRLMDVYWWIKNERMAQDLEFNFPASFSLQRRGLEEPLDDADNPMIMPGDLLHVDFGIRLMGIVTDQQKMAYVLRPSETRPPAGLRELFAQSIRMGEIIAEELVPGRIGYKIDESARERALGEGIDGDPYPHTQGNWVHAAGAWVSPDWPERYGTHPREPVRTNEFWSVEYSVTGTIPEWGDQEVSMMREEDAWIDANGDLRFMAGPQMDLWIVGTAAQVY